MTVRELRASDDPRFAIAHRLLQKEFSVAEMLSLRSWRKTLRERREGLWTDLNWHVLVAERGGKVVGAASGSYLGNVNIGIIGYIAVRPIARSLGIGPRLRRALARCFASDARRLGLGALGAIVGEVRRNNPWLRHLARNRAVIALDFPYVQPSLGGRRRPVPLVLYYESMGAPRASLPSSEVRKLLYTMWRRAYRVSRPLESKEFRAMLKALRGRRSVGRIKPAALDPSLSRRLAAGRAVSRRA